MAMDETRRAVLKHVMEQLIPFNRFLGIEAEVLEEGAARLRLRVRGEFVGDPLRPALHGGLISTLVDTSGGAALWTTLGPLDRISTVDMRVDYLRPARLQDLVAHGTVLRVGNRVGVAAVRVYHPDAEADTIAEGKAVFNIRRESDSQ